MFWIWLMQGRRNILKKYIRKFSRLEDWCRTEYDAVSKCKLLLTLRRTEMPSSSGICSSRRNRQDEGSVFLYRSYVPFDAAYNTRTPDPPVRPLWEARISPGVDLITLNSYICIRHYVCSNLFQLFSNKIIGHISFPICSKEKTVDQIKVKVLSSTGHESPEGSRCIALLFLQPRC